MLTISHYVDCPLPDTVLLPAPLEDILFFDIETTGFSPASSSLYLIGVLALEDGRFKLTQWFATRMSEEEEVLLAFCAYLKRFSCVIHFNGDQFDIPYLEKCASAYHMTLPFSSCTSFDILKQVREKKGLLGLSSCRQKSVEQFLRIHRDDPYDGGQLIPVYEQYLKNHAEELLDLLLLHNAEDVKGMLQLLPILSYGKLSSNSKNMTLESWNQTDNILEICLKNTFHVPVPICIWIDNVSFDIGNMFITMKFQLLEGELKYFYPDFKEYYYLPEEDIAIHKKIAEFVSKEHKKKATRTTAYTKKSGVFVRLPSKAREPFTINNDTISVLKKEYKSKEEFTILQENDDFMLCFGQYIISVLL